jgi:hypothetical protein
MTSFSSPHDLIVFKQGNSKNSIKSNYESSRELTTKLSTLEYALEVRMKAVRETPCHVPVIGMSAGNGQNIGAHMNADDEEGMEVVQAEDGYSSGTPPSDSEDDGDHIEVASSSDEGSQSF